MKAGFEDKFMEIQAELVALCMEAVEGLSVTKIYLCESIEDFSQSFNAFCEVDDMPKYLCHAGVSAEWVDTLLHVGTNEMMTKIRDVCKEYETTRPMEIKAVYDVETGAFDLECKYEPAGFGDPELLDAWYEEIKAQKSADK